MKMAHFFESVVRMNGGSPFQKSVLFTDASGRHVKEGICFEFKTR